MTKLLREKRTSEQGERTTFGDILDFSDRSVGEEPFGDLLLLLVAQLRPFPLVSVRHQ